MNRPHPLNCTCNCHADPGGTRLEIIKLQQDDAVNRRCFIHATLVGFDEPNGYRCRSCGQYYGSDPVTDQLRPITGNQAYGQHPDIKPSRLPYVAPIGWRLLDQFTPDFVPEWFHKMIDNGVRPPTWEVVTCWTMDD